MLPRVAEQEQQACGDAPRQAGLVLGKCLRRPRHGLSGCGISQQARDIYGKRLRRPWPIRGFHQAMGSAEPCDDFTEIEVMRAGDDGAAKPRRFQRVLPAMRHQGPANQRDARQAIEKPQFAKGISDINRNAWPGILPRAAPRNWQIPGQSRDIRPSLRMARHDHRQQAGVIRGEQPMRGQDDFIFPRMGAGGEPDRPPSPSKGQAGKLSRISGQGWRGIF